jgi:6-phosphogluconolactonase
MSEMAPLLFPDADALARAAAVELTRLANEAVAARGLFTLALAGGSTPKKLYHLLAGEISLPWEKMQLFFGDERHVPPDHPESNYRMVRDSLLVSRRVPEKNVHRVRGELPDAGEAAADYKGEMQKFFDGKNQLDGFPRFDLVLLGMGPDGHTASLFPGSPGLEEKSHWVIANPVEKFSTDRITFTFPVLNAARTVLLLVAGADKAPMIAEVLGPRQDHPPYPVQRVEPRQGTKIWMLDQAAAAQLA